MRQRTSAFLAAAIGLALAASAGAQTTSSGAPAGRPSIASNPNGTFIRTPVPTVSGPVNAAPASTGNTNTNTNTPPTQILGNVDVRNQQTNAATAGIHASGSTSALGTLANGAASTNGVTVTGLGVLGNGGTVSGAPIFANPGDVTMGLPATTLAASNGVAASDVFVGSATLATDTQLVAVNGASFDRAVNQVTRDRKRVGRNGQLLNSIAPRTNADLSHQMPDDPLPPALTGSNSTLAR